MGAAERHRFDLVRSACDLAVAAKPGRFELASDLPPEVRRRPDLSSAPAALEDSDSPSLKEKVREAAERVERESIVRALRQSADEEFLWRCK